MSMYRVLTEDRVKLLTLGLKLNRIFGIIIYRRVSGKLYANIEITGKQG